MAIARHPDNVGGVAAARALGMIHVDRAAGDGGQRVLQEAAFVQGVGVDLHLEVEFVGDLRGSSRLRRASSPSPRAASAQGSPVSICSTSDAGLCELPRPRKPKLIGQASAAWSILPVLNGPPESIPTVIGPSEPPSMVVMPLAMA